MTVLAKVASPLVWLLRTVTEGLLTLLGLNRTREEDVTEEEVQSIIAEGEKSGTVMCIPLHPFLIGQPYRLAAFEEALAYITGHDKVWLATGREIAAYFNEHYHDAFAAAALAALSEMKRLDVASNAAARGAEMLAGLQDLKARHPLVGDARGKGLMCCIELVSDRQTKAPASKDAVAKVYETAYQHGAMLRTSATNVIISPPLILSSADVQTIVSALDAGLTAAEA